MTNENRASFPVAELDYVLPPELIAQAPPARREDARLLVVNRARETLEDCSITDFSRFLSAGDLLVLNDTRVLPAKFTARRATGGRVAGLFLEESAPGQWLVLLEGSRRLRPGQVLSALARSGHDVSLNLVESLDQGRWRVRVEPSDDTERILDEIGTPPLPPYIRRAAADRALEQVDRDRYQTVYARQPGAVAAPTAGFHFTQSLLNALRSAGVETAFLTLHVGLGTFKPVSVNDLSEHVMHAERFDLPASTADAVNRCKARGGRVVAVGTTTVRVLETAALRQGARPFPYPLTPLTPEQGQTRLLIYPPFGFRVVDALLTNFHLPQSTLLALVMAFAGVERTRRAYHHAISKNYRFYSFGDAMLIR